MHGVPPRGLRADPEANKDAKRAHALAGTVHQVLVYAEGRCVGWCQYGSPAELPGIKNRARYERAAGAPPTWRIGCVFTASKQRERGVATAALEAVLAAIGEAGGGTVEAYPEQTVDRGPQRGAYLHTGPEALFERFGFVRDRQIAKWRWVMRAEVPATTRN